MAYPVTCGCGKIHEVALSAAGTQFPCSCGRKVDVPSLSVLKSSAGEAVGSPEFRIRAMENSGDWQLPADCMVCHQQSEGVISVDTICERAEVRKGGRSIQAIDLLLMLFLLPLGVFRWRYQREADVEVGRDVSFRLPLRVCDRCRQSINNNSARTLLNQVRTYEQLLQKYPHATLKIVR